jgi:peptidoglycan/LPS O-acetylase OafA/YrhL
MFLTLSGLVARRKDVLHMKHAAAQSHLSCHSEVSRGSHPGSDDQAIGSFTLEKPVSELSGDSKTAAIISRSMVTAGNTEFTQPENRAFYPALDGLRAIAFLMVFGQHYLQIPWGWTGVDLFFVLSGFLITGILFDTRNDAHRVRNFYVRRTLRIFPLYYGIMLAMLLVAPFVKWQWNWHWLVWPAYLGNFARFIHPFKQGDALQMLADFQPSGAFGFHPMFYLGHFWSLCVEEQFYLVWPWLVFWINSRRKLLWVCGLTIPVCLVLRLLGEGYLPGWMLDNEILYRVTPFRLDALFIGGFFALLLRGDLARPLLRFARIAFPVALTSAFLWTLVTPHARLWDRPYGYPTWKFTWGLSAIDILSALLLLVALQPGTFVYNTLSLRPLRWIGRISYGAYVLHDIPHPFYRWTAEFFVRHLEAVMKIGQHAEHLQTAVTAGIGLVMTLFGAWLSYRFYERPFLNLKERWTVR